MRAQALALIVNVPKPELGSTYVTVDDACFCRFEAEAADDNRDANDIAAVPFTRVVATDEIGIVQSELTKKGNLS